MDNKELIADAQRGVAGFNEVNLRDVVARLICALEAAEAELTIARARTRGAVADAEEACRRADDAEDRLAESKAELTRRDTAIETVRGLHRGARMQDNDGNPPYEGCTECGEAWPCVTTIALTGAHDLTVAYDLEGLTEALHRRSHAPAFSDDPAGVRDAKAFAQGLIDRYITQTPGPPRMQGSTK